MFSFEVIFADGLSSWTNFPWLFQDVSGSGIRLRDYCTIFQTWQLQRSRSSARILRYRHSFGLFVPGSSDSGTNAGLLPVLETAKCYASRESPCWRMGGQCYWAYSFICMELCIISDNEFFTDSPTGYSCPFSVDDNGRQTTNYRIELDYAMIGQSKSYRGR